MGKSRPKFNLCPSHFWFSSSLPNEIAGWVLKIQFRAIKILLSILPLSCYKGHLPQRQLGEQNVARTHLNGFLSKVRNVLFFGFSLRFVSECTESSLVFFLNLITL